MTKSEKDSEPVRINKWDSNALKNGLDDVVRKLLKEKFQWTEKHTLADGRLVISFIAVCFAGFALIWDYLHPFPKSRPILIICVLTYFALMSILQMYMWYVEKTVFFQAIDEDPTGKEPNKSWEWSSKIKKYDHLYTLEARFQQGDITAQGSVTKSVANWIDDEGTIILELLKNDVINMAENLITNKKKN